MNVWVLTEIVYGSIMDDSPIIDTIVLTDRDKVFDIIRNDPGRYECTEVTVDKFDKTLHKCLVIQLDVVGNTIVFDSDYSLVNTYKDKGTGQCIQIVNVSTHPNKYTVSISDSVDNLCNVKDVVDYFKGKIEYAILHGSNG